MRAKGITRGMLIPAILLLLCGLLYGRAVCTYGDTMSVRYKDAGLTARQIDQLYTPAGQERMDGQEIPYITGWRSTQETLISNTELNRTGKAELIEVYGDMTAVYPAVLLHGSFVQKEDIKGCVLSGKAAEELFLSREVTGCEVTLDGMEYIVRGILSSDEAVMLIQTGADESAVFPCLELKYAHRHQPASNMKNLLTALGLPEYVSFTEGNLYVGITRLIMGLPFLVILVRLLRFAIGWIKREDKMLRRSLLTGGAVTVFVLLLVWLMTYSLAFSEDYIPSGVSDFSFWSQKYRTVWMDYRAVVAYGMGYREEMLFQALRCTAAACAASGYLFSRCKVQLPKCSKYMKYNDSQIDRAE